MKTSDQAAIRAIIERQFESLNWRPNEPANWSGFLEDFLPGAALYPAARPAKSQKPEEFVERMKGLATSKLLSFKEKPLGFDIRVFGTVAIAVAICQITENEMQVSRGIEMMLLVKTDDRWQIASQAWDTENESKPIPPGPSSVRLTGCRCGSDWHSADVEGPLLDICFRGNSGHGLQARGLLLTHLGHRPAFHIAVAKRSQPYESPRLSRYDAVS